jgi:hypothetical protein
MLICRFPRCLRDRLCPQPRIWHLHNPTGSRNTHPLALTSSSPMPSPCAQLLAIFAESSHPARSLERELLPLHRHYSRHSPHPLHPSRMQIYMPNRNRVRLVFGLVGQKHHPATVLSPHVPPRHLWYISPHKHPFHPSKLDFRNLNRNQARTAVFGFAGQNPPLRDFPNATRRHFNYHICTFHHTYNMVCA